MRPNFEIENKYSDEACTFLEKFFPFSETNKTKSIATIKNGGQCNSFLSDRNFFAKSESLQLPKLLLRTNFTMKN